LKVKNIEPRISYGCDDLGKLESVLLHTPGDELSIINDLNHQHWLFDEVPDIPKFVEEHRRYRDLLVSLGIKVHELSDHVHDNRELISGMPNITYLHDTAVVSRKGAMLSRMRPPGRKNEEIVIKEALTNLGIPILTEFNGERGSFEGCLLLSENTVLVANTERHTFSLIEKFISEALKDFEEIIYVDIPKARRFMHPDTIFNRVKHDLALAYLPVFRETYLYGHGYVGKIDFVEYLREKGIRVIPVSDSEQKRLACSFVPLESGTIIHYDTALDRETRELLAKEGVEIITFHPEAMLAGGGSLRCLTLRLHRKQEKVLTP
jgi:arginine deiminase